MATCDVQTLFNDANCFNTLSPGQRNLMVVQLLCDLQASSSGGVTTITTSQVTATDVGVLLVGSSTTRKSVTFKNTSATDSVWIGPSGVTTADGFELDPGEGLTLRTLSEVYGITSAGTTAVVGIIEESSA